MSKKVLILKGSPRPQGNSNTLADQVFAGAQAAGAEVESITLHDLDIRPCDACAFCEETEGVCVIKDDMQALYPKLAAADALVFASPIYWFSISAQLKLCIDRWYAFEFMEDHPLKNKQVGIVLTYGDDDPLTSGAANATQLFQAIFDYLHGDIQGIVHGTANDPDDIQKQPELLEQAHNLGLMLGKNGK